MSLGAAAGTGSGAAALPGDRERIKALEREVRQLRRASERAPGVYSDWLALTERLKVGGAKMPGVNRRSVTLAMSCFDQPPTPDGHRLPRGTALRIIILLSLIIWAAIIILLVWCFR